MDGDLFDCPPAGAASDCARYQEDQINPGEGSGLCFVPDNGFGKTVPTCADVLRQGKCRYGYKSPYGIPERSTPLPTYDQMEFALKSKGYWTPADERRQAEGAKMEIPAVIDADEQQAAVEARIRGCGA